MQVEMANRSAPFRKSAGSRQTDRLRRLVLNPAVVVVAGGVLGLLAWAWSNHP